MRCAAKTLYPKGKPGRSKRAQKGQETLKESNPPQEPPRRSQRSAKEEGGGRERKKKTDLRLGRTAAQYGPSPNRFCRSTAHAYCGPTAQLELPPARASSHLTLRGRPKSQLESVPMNNICILHNRDSKNLTDFTNHK